ncbi:hypothetical protein RQP46_000468 [Phenoliferia psychrophenolica]
MAYSQSSHTNNPFAAGSVPGALEATANRFPAVDVDSPSQQYQQQPQYAPQQQAPQQQQQQFLQPQYTAQPPQAQSQFTGYPGGGSSSGFQPQSYGGQQIQSQVTGIQQAQQYGGGSPYQQGMNGAVYGGGVSAQGFGGGGYQQQGGFGGQPQPQQQAFVSDLDPYGNLGTLANAGGGGGQAQQASGASSPAPQQQPEAHPRTFVQTHKAQLTQWDDYSWKQLLNRVDGLREAWEARKNAVTEVQGKGGDPYTVEQLRKEAENNIGKSLPQCLQAGWRHSTDLASKARVREALNSGLNSLPEFPKALAPEQLGGIFAQRATEDFRKQSILQHFNTPQQQGLVPLYAQPTGYPGAGMMQQQQTGYPQQTGFQPQQQFLGPQQTGFYGGGYQPQGPQYYG